ncbi:hypothetical protein LPJ73_003424, partial [Coemansia sp. RSA 2703]
ELEKEVAQMKEIERKKLKIEADNESLLRQLWKSQKERDRLQRELVKQQNSVFLPRQSADNKDAVDNASVIRRQTWFPGLLVPISENDSSTGDTQQGSSSPPEMDVGTTMDVDIVASNLPPQDENGALVSKELYQIALDRIGELEGKSDLLQQQHSEISRGSKEMEDTIQRYMREYNLLLTTLNQLAAADVIPPSPVKGEPLSSSQPPRELAQIRRKLRALMVTIDASQRMCQKFRSQRPEAEFLEMELQATRETLIQKEEELVEVMRESDELFSRFSRTEEDYTKLQGEAGLMRVKLSEASDAQLALETARTALVAQLEQERHQFSTELQSFKTQAASEMQMTTDSLRSEITALEIKSAEQIEYIDSLKTKLSGSELALQSEIESYQAIIQDHQSTVAKLQMQLAESAMATDELKVQCEKVAILSADASNKESEIVRLKAVVDDLNMRAVEHAEIISTLESKLKSQETALSQKTHETEHLLEQVSSLTNSLDALKLQIVESESAHSTQIGDYTSKLDSLQSAYAQERQTIENQLTEKENLINSMQSDIDSLKEQIVASNEAVSSVTGELSRAIQQADMVPNLNTEISKLQTELSVAISDKESLLADLDLVKRERDDIVNEHKRVCAKVEELEGQNADIWERVSELTVSNNDLSTKLQQSQQEVVDGVARIKDLEASVSSAEEHSASLQADIDRLIDSHRSELAGTEHNTADVMQKLMQSEEHFAKKQEEWKLLISEKEKLVAAAETKLEIAVADYEQHLDVLRAGSSEAKEQAEMLQRELDSANSHLETLRRDMTQIENSKNVVAELNIDLSSQLEAKSVALQDFEERQKQLCADLETSKQELLTLQSEFDKKQSSWEQENSDAQQQIAQLRAEITQEHEQLEQQRDSAQSSTLEMATRIHDLESAAEQLAQKIVEAGKVEAELQSQLASKGQSHEALVLALRKDISQLEEQVRALHEEVQTAVDTAEQTRASHEASLKDLEAKHLSACGELTVLQKERDDLVQSLRDQEALADRLSKSADDTAKQLRQLQETHQLEVAEMQTQMDSLIALKEQALQDAANARDEHNAAVEHMDNVKATLTDAESRYSNLCKEHEMLLVDLSTARADALAKSKELDVAKEHAGQLESMADSYKAQLEQTQCTSDELQKRICELEMDIQHILAERKATDENAATARSAAEEQIISLNKAIEVQSDDI